MTTQSSNPTATTAPAAGTVPQPRQGAPAREVSQERLEHLLGQVVADLGGALTAPLVRGRRPAGAVRGDA